MYIHKYKVKTSKISLEKAYLRREEEKGRLRFRCRFLFSFSRPLPHFGALMENGYFLYYLHFLLPDPHQTISVNHLVQKMISFDCCPGVRGDSPRILKKCRVSQKAVDVFSDGDLIEQIR